MGLTPRIVGEKLKSAKEKALEYYNKLPNPIRWLVGHARKQIYSLLEDPIKWGKNKHAQYKMGKTELWTDAGGVVDKTGSGVIKSVVEAIGKPEEGKDTIMNKVREGAAVVGRWGEGLDRSLPEPGSDEEVLAIEKSELADFGRDIGIEMNTDYEQMAPDEEMIARAMTGHINRGNSKTIHLLPPDHPLSKKTRRRAVYFSKHQPKDLTPFSRAAYEPLEAPEDKNDKEAYKKYIDGRRIVQDKRRKMNYSEYWHTFDLADLDFPLEGNFHLLLDKIYQNKDFKKDLFTDKSHMTVAVYSSGSKLTIGLVALKDNSLVKTTLPEQPSYVGSKWWFNKLPATKRAEGSDLWKIFNGVEGEHPAFNSGYSLYHFGIFQDKMEELGQAHDIKIEKVEIQPKDNVGTRIVDTLHISVKIGGKNPEIIRLVKGTNMVQLPAKSAALTEEDEGEAEKTESGDVFMTLAEYFEKIKSQTTDEAGENRIPPKKYRVLGTPVSAAAERNNGGRSGRRRRRATEEDEE